MYSPRDIIKREGNLYVVEQVVEDDRGSQLLVRELDGDVRWIFNSHGCERVGRPVKKS
jgi:hypothetical protein